MLRHQIPTPEELDTRVADAQRRGPAAGSLVDLERQRINLDREIDRLLLSFDGDTAEALSEAQDALTAFGAWLRAAITASSGSS